MSYDFLSENDLDKMYARIHGFGSNGQCWEWDGNSSRKPSFSIVRADNGKPTTIAVQHFMLQNFLGRGLVSKIVDPICGNRMCCNPQHLQERTLENRLKNYEVLPSGCWKWLGNVMPNGYGYLTVTNSNISAHRASYLLHKGDIPKHLMVLHSPQCTTRLCINPDHLRLGTHDENMIDMENSNILKGENNGMAILTEESVREIKQKIRSRLITYQTIANEYGVSRQAVKDIALGRTWRWLE